MTPEQMMQKILELEKRIQELEGHSPAPAASPDWEKRVAMLEESEKVVIGGREFWNNILGEVDGSPNGNLKRKYSRCGFR